MTAYRRRMHFENGEGPVAAPRRAVLARAQTADREGSRSWVGLRSLWAQLAMQLTAFARNPRSIFFTLAFPLVMIMLFCGGSAKSTPIPAQGIVPVSEASWTILGLCGYTLVMGAFVGVASDLAIQRSTCLLKRLRLRSASDGAVVAGYMLKSALVALVCTSVTILVGILGFQLPLPKDPLMVFAVVLAATAVLSLMGAAYASFIPSADSAQIMLLPPALVLMFLSGIFQPVWTIPEVFRSAASWFPLEHLVDALRSAWLGIDVSHAAVTAQGLVIPPGVHYLSVGGSLVVGAWCVGALVVAVTRFRWDPRH